MRSKEAGGFCEVAGVSILAAGGPRSAIDFFYYTKTAE